MLTRSPPSPSPRVKDTLTVSSNSITATGATLTLGSWQGRWWYKEASGTCSNPVDANTPTVTLTGLTHNTPYTYTAYHTSGCTSGNEMTDAESFTTLEVTLTVSNVGTNKATLTLKNWTQAWSYQQQGDTRCSPGTPTVNLTGLTPNTTYTAYLGSGCQSTHTTVDSPSFTTQPLPTNPGGGGGGGGGGGAAAEPAPVQGWLESPANGATVSGIDIIRGWSFAEARSVRIEQVQLYLNGRRTAVIPCCSTRPDVAAAYPTFPRTNTSQSGWGITTNWGNLPPGRHVVQVAVTSTDEGRWVSERHTITVLKPGDIAYATRFSLAEAEARLESGQLVLDGVVIADATTEHEIAARYAWQTGAQGFRLVSSRTLQTARTQPFGLERLLAGLWQWGQRWLSPPNVTATEGLTKDYEAPANQARIAGIGLIRGWAFPDDPNDTIAAVAVQIGPTLRESAPCCSTRPDVAAAFPDQANAELSGWGLVFNYGRLPEGTQPVTATITTTAGLTHTATHTAVVAKLGGYAFVNQFDLSGAEVELVGEEIILSGVEVRDSATQATQTIEVRLRWSRATQGLVIVGTEVIP